MVGFMVVLLLHGVAPPMVTNAAEGDLHATGASCLRFQPGFRGAAISGWRRLFRPERKARRNPGSWTGQSLVIWGGVEAIAGVRDGAQWTPE